MKDYLLNIFPLQGVEAYARVSCIALEESSNDCSAPFTTSRNQMVKFLQLALTPEKTETVLTRLDLGQAVQLPVSTEQARVFGFVPKVN